MNTVRIPQQPDPAAVQRAKPAAAGQQPTPRGTASLPMASKAVTTPPSDKAGGDLASAIRDVRAATATSVVPPPVPPAQPVKASAPATAAGAPAPAKLAQRTAPASKPVSADAVGVAAPPRRPLNAKPTRVASAPPPAPPAPPKATSQTAPAAPAAPSATAPAAKNGTVTQIPVVAPAAAPGADRAGAAAMALLKLDSEMRKARSLSELAYFIANEPRSVTRAQQIAVLERKSDGSMSVRAVTAATRIDRSSPLVLWFEATVAALARDHGLDRSREFDAAAFATEFDSVRDAYPLRALLWVPFLDHDGRPLGGMLQTRSTPWTESDITVSSHLASGFAIGWMALSNTRPILALPGRISRRTSIIAAVLLLIVAAFPVSMSALAPVEVAPRDSFVVTTGVEGVIDQILVEPNATVKKGQPLVRLADTVLKNRLDVADREVGVAETKYKKAAQLAFVETRGRHEMALAKSELELKTTERDYARDLLDRATIKAERDGVAFFGDKRDLVGRPVAVGEKLMEIADPAASEFRIDLSVADAIVLHDKARIKVLLDSDPLRPIEARLVRADYQARVHDGQQLAFRLIGDTATPATVPLQLGVRGTAQIYSDRVPLAFYLFRRPIAAARHWVGF